MKDDVLYDVIGLGDRGRGILRGVAAFGLGGGEHGRY
jgi:hypothetical protein